jgi:hypothetical protein
MHQNHESNQRHRRHNGNFVNRDTLVNDGFKNLKLFISEATLSAETDDERRTTNTDKYQAITTHRQRSCTKFRGNDLI